MPEGTTTRKLVRQEWKPLAGRRVERFSAMPASNTVPGMEWTDDLPGKSEVVNEVIGYAELESHSKFPAFSDFREFVKGLDEEAVRIITWENGWQDEAEDILTEPSDEGASEEEEVVEDYEALLEAVEEEEEDPEVSPDEESSDEASSDAVEDPDEEAMVVTTDGAGSRVLVEYDEDDEPYRLPGSGDVEDLRPGVVYEAVVNGVETYGIFVTIPETHANRYDDVTGIVHTSELGLRSASDFERGDRLTVEHLSTTDKGPTFSLRNPLDDEEELENLHVKEQIE